jgi:hypothetical protein
MTITWDFLLETDEGRHEPETDRPMTRFGHGRICHPLRHTVLVMTLMDM